MKRIQTYPLPQIPIEPIADPWLQRYGVHIDILRCDLVHPELSGNKLFKLKYNLRHVRDTGCRRVVSFGGPYSNHLHALAAAGAIEGVDTVGVIRGELPKPLNSTLADAQQWGMKLIAINREAYRQQRETLCLEHLGLDATDTLLIPEGGANTLGVRGAMDMLAGLSDAQLSSYSSVVLPVGTGTTLAGVIAHVAARKLSTVKVVGVVVLKNIFQPLKVDIQMALKQVDCESAIYAKHWCLDDAYHCGGYAKIHPELIAFMDRVEERTQLPSEPIYSGKMLYAVYRKIIDQQFRRNSRILLVHTGGLQGLRGMQNTIKKQRERLKSQVLMPAWYE